MIVSQGIQIAYLILVPEHGCMHDKHTNTKTEAEDSKHLQEEPSVTDISQSETLTNMYI